MQRAVSLYRKKKIKSKRKGSIRIVFSIQVPNAKTIRGGAVSVRAYITRANLFYTSSSLPRNEYNNFYNVR